MPPGLRTLSAAQQALTDFLRLDQDLLDIAAAASPALEAVADDPRELAGRIANLAKGEKERLLDAPASQRAKRERQATARRAEEQARRERARALAHSRRLDELAHEGDAAWARVDAMIATRKPAEYDAAVRLLTDLRALADRDGQLDTFT